MNIVKAESLLDQAEKLIEQMKYMNVFTDVQDITVEAMNINYGDLNLACEILNKDEVWKEFNRLFYWDIEE